VGGLTPSDLLELWERGPGRSPAERALLLLAATSPGTSSDALARLSIGERDARLLALREATFGPTLVGLATCPACRDSVELSVEAAGLRVAAEPDPQIERSLAVAGGEVHFRVPDSLDLAAIAGTHDVAIARQRLIERCVSAVDREGHPLALDQLPAGVLEAIAERMARADPQADVRFALACPSCAHRWEATFDIATFLWREVEAWALRLLREVHTLAMAYGWREAEILAMHPVRRQVYLAMVGE
jgi:hypothetical protein